MARTAATIIPAQSTDAKDKLLACLNWPVGRMKLKTDATYQAAPFYFDACWEWYRSLSSDQQDAVGGITDAYSMPDRRKAAETWAAALPPAPRCPV
jgi:hypothetical protein